MARMKKNRKVDSVSNRAGMSVDIMFNPNTTGTNALGFSAEFLEEHFYHKDSDKVKAWAREKMAESLDLKWFPLIEVNCRYARDIPFASHLSSGLALTTDRFWYCNRDDGTVIQCAWNMYEARNQANTLKYSRRFWWGGKGPLVLPKFKDSTSKENVVYLPFTEEMWLGLEKLKEMLDRLEKELSAMLTTEAGIGRIQDVGIDFLSKLLAAETPAAEPVDVCCEKCGHLIVDTVIRTNSIPDYEALCQPCFESLGGYV